ncbi:glycerophosphodiester phosphodiesterase [Streptomyces halobius]|uniref:Glycerophosphodiester phosphodiesterase n=1 Tax=Streptomyces halobius TaxID=2879846 RepID=A0ABY4M9E4_9ACTN|nr:glycerophosphodiester phosphodiesterase family protein [Streptomyces halobius]UQA93977.1 glycerophosphodiester phosphodiesterase [Streptomyces halobius]
MLQRLMRIAAAALALQVTAAMSSSAVAVTPGDGVEARSIAGAEAPLVIAHRGAAQHAPENTLAAVDAAHRRGLVWVENDVQRTEDGQLIVIHDTTLKRTTDAEKVFPDRAPWRVGDFTAAEIARLDAGSWFGKRFAGERVPTLASFLRRLDRNGQRLLLEIKAPRRYPGIEAQIVRELRAQGWLDRAHVRSRLVVQSFCVPCIKRVHELAPEVRTGILVRTEILGVPEVDELERYARFADQINPRISALSSRWVEAVHRLRGAHGRPLEIYAWDVGEDGSPRAASMSRIEGIIA